ncbi:vitamin K epoxide reductase complex subunit 1-like protein 1 [Physella acuta]|uniref:vitamin K epoxide reductase complex subunit 1-like protein 1 n=1 Tax=Physella acuta TaxID=109671 RepID=UPI0027DBD9D3|nr:vitamin K epoxide reductase complex subunit 1-like protein 1 [Physella acuta]XP_059146217.1 vitamin K epoxide reductase complex subunit 1-like protein 1 [Physella acuta]
MDSHGEPAYILWSNLTDIVFFNVLGVVTCLYALHVEVNKERDPSYRAACDLSEHMSCSRVLTSKYSQGFGVMHLLFGENHMLNSRNCNIGLVIYIINILLCVFLPSPMAATILYYGSIVSVLGCVYLAFILFVVLKDVCIVCMSMYGINAVLLYLTYKMHSFYN